MVLFLNSLDYGGQLPAQVCGFLVSRSLASNSSMYITGLLGI